MAKLPLLFNTTPQAVIPDTVEQIAIGKYLRGAWGAFAKDPVNGLTKYGWPQYSTSGQTLIKLGFNNNTGLVVGAGNEYDAACQGVPTVTSPPTSSTAKPTSTSTPTSTTSAVTTPNAAVAKVPSEWMGFALAILYLVYLT